MDIEKEIKDRSQQTMKEVKWWSYAAWTFPFVALFTIGFIYFIGLETLINKVLVAIFIIVASIAVFWWWWAIYKIYNFAYMLQKTSERLQSIKKQFSNIKNDLDDR